MKRVIGALLCAAFLIFVPLGAGAPDASAASTVPHVTRVTGADQFAVAENAAHAYTAGQPVVFVVHDRAHPDALVAAGRAGAINAPVLLVRTTSIPAATRAALTYLTPRRIVVVGDTRVISSSVATALSRYARTGTVERVTGTDRFATAAAMANKYASGPQRAYLVAGDGFADALPAVALAASQKAPVLLTTVDQLPSSTRDSLRRLRPAEIVIVGDTANVSDRVMTDAAAYATTGRVSRLGGGDRYVRAAQIAATFSNASAGAYISNPDAYPEGVVAATMAGRFHLPLLFVDSGSVPAPTWQALNEARAAAVVAVGTVSHIGESVIAELGRPLPVPPPASVKLGGYLGNAYENPDERFRAAFGAWPELASTYYQADGMQGGTLNVAYEQARIDHGTIPVLTVTSKKGPYTMAQIGSGAADAWIDRWAADLASLKGEVWFTFEHEFEVKLNQGVLPATTTLQEYIAAYNRFRSHVKAQAPNVKFLYWYGHYDRAKIDVIGAGITPPDIIGFDPYVYARHSGTTTLEQMIQPKLDWLRARPWYHDQRIVLTEFGMDTIHGDQTVARFVTDLRPRLAALGIWGALWFCRDRANDINANIASGAWPLAAAAFSASLRQ